MPQVSGRVKRIHACDQFYRGFSSSESILNPNGPTGRPREDTGKAITHIGTRNQASPVPANFNNNDIINT